VLPAPRSLLILVLLSGLALTSAHARLGETLDQIKARFGAPAGSPHKDVQVWYFEVQDGQVLYTVTFDAKGKSIAEGLKPVKQALFGRELAESFIGTETEPYRDSKTLRVVKTGEKYTFAGKEFICGDKEYVMVDEANAFLLVLSREGVPSIIVVRPEIMR
jgi:hypothetical protein